ncbi:uncharacterized protein [Triticum aestivum]|uniref:uncharacterized protein n=1 Tax=Triticum aestivum TaxID=4565 RepID=UPI001D0280F5|nr:uncharacterized protein LOC123149654 [Triticum aestivum]
MFSWCGGAAGKKEEVSHVTGVLVEPPLREIRPRREPWLGEAAGGAKKQGRQATRTRSSGLSWCGGAAGKKEEVSRVPVVPVELLLSSRCTHSCHLPNFPPPFSVFVCAHFVSVRLQGVR